MSSLSLNPLELAVDSFTTDSVQPASGTTEPVPTTMRTYERDCTYPDLCTGTA
jgi:hypothetical protein